MVTWCTLTTDSASNIKWATEDLGWRHISYFGHYLSEDELAFVKEEGAVDIDVMDVMDQNSQGDRNEEEQQHQKDADVMSCEE